MGFCDCVEDDGVLGIKPTWLWPRRRRAVAAAGAVELGAVAVVLESVNGKGEEVAGLTAITMRQTGRSGMSWCGGDGKGDLRRRSVKTRSKKTKQSVRVLGARLARRSRRRRSSWARQRGAGTTVDASFMVARARQRRPWWERARERGRGVSEVSARPGQ